MSDLWSSEQLKAHFRAKAKKPKYGQKAKEYNGVKYHSTKEAAYAIHLDILKLAKVVERWERQLRYVLGVNGTVVTTYILDFKVWYADGRIDHIDVKGYKKGSAYNTFMIKKKLMLGCYGIEVIEK